MTNKPWLDHYPEGMPATIEYHEYRSLAEFFVKKSEQFSSLPAFSNFGTTMTYSAVESCTRAFASYLRNELGLQKGDRIAIMLPNLLQTPIAVLGALRAGLIVVNVNPLYTARELKHQLNDAGANTIVILENCAHILESVQPEVPMANIITTQVGDMLKFPKSCIVNFTVKHVRKMVPPYKLDTTATFTEALKKGASYRFEAVDIDQSDIAFLQYTGGTTGLSKGAMLTHGNVLANVAQATEWVMRSSPQKRRLNLGQEVMITALPLYHIFSLTANCLTFINLGGLSHLITNPRDLPAFVKELSKIPFTCITGVNTLYNGLMNTPGFKELDFSKLKVTLGGGMSVQKTVAQNWQYITGSAIIEAYGLTEASPAVCINPLDQEEFTGSVGLPLPSTECVIRDDDGNDLPLGETGELCVRGPQVMQGYWNQPEETASTLSEDGWLHTGDLARMDENGYIFIVDRKKDMIIVSGFNVYPNEIEAVVSSHPGILECAVIGITSDASGEAAKLFLVKKNKYLDEDTIRKYLRLHLTAYKVPRYIEFREELPKSNIGKVLRRELREPERKPG